jgi:hypothetical protein
MSRHVDIEQVGTGGTSLGRFTRTRPVASAVELAGDSGRPGGYELRSLTPEIFGEVWGYLYPAGNPGYYFPWHADEIHGTQHPATDGSRTFMDAVAAILGKPGAGYTHYRKAA